MLFFSFFKTLVDHEITVELKNEVCIRGTLKSVDQYLNIKLDNAEATDEHRWPHLCSTRDMFIRGSVVRYVHLPAQAVDTALLEDATRREAEAARNKAKQDLRVCIEDSGGDASGNTIGCSTSLAPKGNMPESPISVGGVVESVEVPSNGFHGPEEA